MCRGSEPGSRPSSPAWSLALQSQERRCRWSVQAGADKAATVEHRILGSGPRNLLSPLPKTRALAFALYELIFFYLFKAQPLLNKSSAKTTEI